MSNWREVGLSELIENNPRFFQYFLCAAIEEPQSASTRSNHNSQASTSSREINIDGCGKTFLELLLGTIRLYQMKGSKERSRGMTEQKEKRDAYECKKNFERWRGQRRLNNEKKSSRENLTNQIITKKRTAEKLYSS
ncbi:hypothetical protein JTB14_003273 [Gonioctena quinquepunctata]|nr:hypothetical protein JTB14_003273 [Gonioctena quinquepunctata]